MSDETLWELGFPAWTEAAGRQSVADLYKPRQRCGIYVLGFANGERYVGQAVDVVRRFAQHRKVHTDIAQVTFLRVTKPDLSPFETRCIHALETAGMPLRNVAQMSFVTGERDIDLVVTPEAQNAWLNTGELLPDLEKHVQDDSLRRRLSRRLTALQQAPMADDALYLLGLYLNTAIPAPRRTELTFWMVSCLPYGWQENTVLFRVSLNMQEVFTLLLTDGEIWASFHLARTPFEQKYEAEWQETLSKIGYELTEHAYKPGGQDQFQLIADGFEAIQNCICDPVPSAAMRLLNLRLMRKGPTYYGPSHCLDVVDAAFETFQRLEAHAETSLYADHAPVTPWLSCCAHNQYHRGRIMNKHRRSALGIAILSLSVMALAATTYTVQLNGQKIPGSAIVQGGKTYISSDVLKAAGINVSVKGKVVSLSTAAGGADQVSAVEGCLNQQLFNGVWRFKVLDISGDESSGWKLKLELRNGSTVSGYSLGGSGLVGFNLQLESGKVIAADSSVLDISNKAFIPGEAFTSTVNFNPDGKTGKPVKLVVPIDPQGIANTPLKFTVKDPSFRVDLTCKK